MNAGFYARTRLIIKYSLTFLLCILLFSGLTATNVHAARNEMISGSIYEGTEKAHYNVDGEMSAAKAASAYGRLSLSGDIVDTTQKNGVDSYAVDGTELAISYTYGDTLLNADVDSWHLIEDKTKTVNDIQLKNNILKGALILQTSTDGINWITDYSASNVFATTPVQTNAFYNTSKVQLVNGCYYRILVAYELSMRSEKSNFLFVQTDTYEKKKVLESYEFYAYDTNSAGKDQIKHGDPYQFNSFVKVKEYDGYDGEQTMKDTDPHFKWRLGQFLIDGYTTDKIENGNPVFLKNVGDQVVLWFQLEQDINKLNGDSKLSIVPDSDGSDLYFKEGPTNFGRGALIIRKTDRRNGQTQNLYTNYLQANVTAGANTKVQICEEGDYEVALDYSVQKDNAKVFGQSILPEVGHYRIYFKFSVRNGNCMVYPFDAKTKSELSNSAITPNGFYLSFANSQYLDVNIKREILKDGSNGLTEDTRFNRPAADQEKYTDEGIYTIEATNRYTGQTTTKKIYVGENDILKAYMVTGLSVSEIENQIALGAIIEKDGTITPPKPVETPAPTEVPTEIPTEAPTVASSETEAPNDGASANVATSETTDDDAVESTSEDDTTNPEGKHAGAAVFFVVLTLIAAISASAIVYKRNKSNQSEKGDGNL